VVGADKGDRRGDAGDELAGLTALTTASTLTALTTMSTLTALPALTGRDQGGLGCGEPWRDQAVRIGWESLPATVGHPVQADHGSVSPVGVVADAESPGGSQSARSGGREPAACKRTPYPG
jgi:hypothetical protein